MEYKLSFWRFLFKEKWINWHVPYHLHHFNGKNFTNLIKKCGFKIIKKKSITPNIWTLMQLRTIRKSILIGEKNNQWITDNRSNTMHKNDKTIFNKLEIFLKKLLKIFILFPITIFNRFIDLFGLGDSLIFFIKVNN